MKTVYRASNAIEGNIVKGMLESHNIEAHAQGEHMSTAIGGLIDVRIQVADQDEHRAKRIVAEYQASKSNDKSAEDE